MASTSVTDIGKVITDIGTDFFDIGANRYRFGDVLTKSVTDIGQAITDIGTDLRIKDIKSVTDLEGRLPHRLPISVKALPISVPI